jgi:hypothetical protein
VRALIRALIESSLEKKELNRRNYPSRGYYVATELVSIGKGLDSTEMKSAYTDGGHYIGTPKNAYYFTVKRGIRPELASKDHSVCSIGYCDKEGKWYGWSHRAISGFKSRKAAVKFARSVS